MFILAPRLSFASFGGFKMSTRDFDHDGYTALTDCNNFNAAIHPGATEHWYDGVDQNCDGRNDYDRDGDGFISDDYGGDDCDDSETGPSVNPSMNEIYDGIDNDCNGIVEG